MKDKILKSLNTSWNGKAVNGTAYTQWFATSNFFELWKDHKDEIKSAGFSLYKHPELSWVVTKFNSNDGNYESFDAFKKVCFETIKETLISEVKGSRLSENDIYSLIEEIKNANTENEFWDIVRDECEPGLVEYIDDFYYDLLHN